MMESSCSEEENTIQTTFDTTSGTSERGVSCEQYDAILRILEDERIAHAQTKAQLMEAEDKLEFAEGEIEVLKKQIQREKLQFEKSFEVLKSKSLKESYRNSELQNTCSVMKKKCEERDDTLGEREQELQQLSEQLEGMRSTYERQLIDLSVRQQQEAYISRTLNIPSRSSKGELSAFKPHSQRAAESDPHELCLHQVLNDSRQMRREVRQNRLPPRH